MTKFIMIAFIALLAAKACDEARISELDNGVITKADLRECACCGGWFIEIGDTGYRFYEVPENSDVVVTMEKLPMEVALKWEKVKDPCLGDEIKVYYIEER